MEIIVANSRQCFIFDGVFPSCCFIAWNNNYSGYSFDVWIRWGHYTEPVIKMPIIIIACGIYLIISKNLTIIFIIHDKT